MDVLTLRDKVIALGLYGASDIVSVSPAELAAGYNGCGPAWLGEKARAKLTTYFAIFEPAILIHDFRFTQSDGTSSGFNYANMELEMNLRIIAKVTYPWYNWRRYRALAAASIITEACVRFGWSAWAQGNRERGTGAEGVGVLPCCLLLLAAMCLTGCYRSIELVREGEYSLTYTAVGLKTDVSKIEAEKMTNGTVRVFVEGVATDVSERNAKIVESSGTAVGNVAQKVVEGLK